LEHCQLFSVNGAYGVLDHFRPAGFREADSDSSDGRLKIIAILQIRNSNGKIVTNGRV
jgi:hypothetical protein